MKTEIVPEMIDQETFVLNIKITMSAQWFLQIAGQVYQQIIGRPMDMSIKNISKDE